MDYVIDNVTVSTDKREDAGQAALIAYDMAYAAKKNEKKEEDKSSKFLRREFNYTRFEQMLLLPENVDREKITAKVCSGVLHITLPKLENFPAKEPTRVIEIQ